MKTKIILIVLWAIMVSATLAQKVVINKMESLPIEEGYYPQFSVDDQKVFYTSLNYQGLWEFDLHTRNTRQLTDDFGAGYQFQLSEDGMSIIYRCDNFDQPKKRSAIKVIHLKDASKKIIQPFAVEVSPPYLVAKDQLFYTLALQPRIKVLSVNKMLKATALANPVVTIEDQKMALYIRGKKIILDPIKDGSYFWQSLSPDKKKILFTEARQGTFVCDLDGNILTSLGKANAPQWSPDGQWICYMDDKDNGYFVTSSDIHIVRADGSGKMALTSTRDIHEMYPQWAHHSEKIVVNTEQGKVFLIDFRFEK